MNMRACAAGKSERTTVGVGEQVTLSFEPKLYDYYRWPTWGHSGGSISPDTVPPNARNDIQYTASSQKNADRVMANFDNGGIGTLTLTTTFTVKEPTGYDSSTKPTSPYCYGSGTVAAGMSLGVVIAPTDVSFKGVTIYEVGRDASGLTGWFAAHGAPSHIGNGADLPISLGCDNSWTDPAFGYASSFAPGWSVGNEGGSFTWQIPVDWQVGAGTRHRITGWTQRFDLTSGGTVTVTKFGHSADRARGDNCSTLR